MGPPRGKRPGVGSGPGKGGPAAMPSALRVLRGGKPRDEAEPVPGELPVEPPACLTEAALAEWERLAPDLQRRGLLTGWDVEPFAIYCEAVAARHRAAVILQSDGELVPGRNGLLVRNPAFQIWRDNAMVILAAASRFGFTPSDRASIKTPAPPDSGEALFAK